MQKNIQNYPWGLFMIVNTNICGPIIEKITQDYLLKYNISQILIR
jgi:hypothetical protein